MFTCAFDEAGMHTVELEMMHYDSDQVDTAKAAVSVSMALSSLRLGHHHGK